MSEEALQISEERREVKRKGERERYPQLNAEFQRIMRDEKALFNEQCKIIIIIVWEPVLKINESLSVGLLLGFRFCSINLCV